MTRWDTKTPPCNGCSGDFEGCCFYSGSDEKMTTKSIGPVSKDPNDQPPPKPSLSPAIWPLVVDDMRTRDNVGRARYGTPLQAHNGRDALKDAYQEALDLAVYLRQAIFERDGQ